MGLAHIHIRLYTRSCYIAWVSFSPIYNDPLMFCVRASLLGRHTAWRFRITDGRLYERYLSGLCTESFFPKCRARKSAIVYTAFTSNFFSRTFFPSAYIFFQYFLTGEGPIRWLACFLRASREPHDSFTATREMRRVLSDLLQERLPGGELALYLATCLEESVATEKSNRSTGPLSCGMERVQHTRSLKPGSLFCGRVRIVVLLILHACPWSYTRRLGRPASPRPMADGIDSTRSFGLCKLCQDGQCHFHP